MPQLMHRNKSAQTHQFAMIPQPNIPRSSFKSPQTLKTAFDAGYLIPILTDEVLPGDTWQLRHTIFCRLATQILPVMDNLHLDTFYFFVPNRLIWNNWQKFMGEQDNPGDSISYLTPQQVSPVGGYAVGSLQDYMGLPTVGQLGGAATKSHNALPTRAYNLIYNTWFRDENLQNSVVVDKGDGPDATPSANYILRRPGKRPDYFTSCLPWPQKGNTGVSIPLSGTAPVISDGTNIQLRDLVPGVANADLSFLTATPRLTTVPSLTNASAVAFGLNTGLAANLSAASGVLINQLRQSIMIQELLEIDARGGTRYTEILRAHFGVMSPDARLQRPEYLGGGSTPVIINPITQNTQSGVTGGTTPMGTLAGVGTVTSHGDGFTQSFTEHGWIIGLAAVRADLTYQQGIHRKWTRSTRYDYYFPAFAHLGEKAVRNDEIYCDGSATDIQTFGYQEAWAEYRYKPNMVTGLMRSTAATTIDAWHLAQRFTGIPSLNSSFIQDTPPVSRIVAVGAAANGQQLICDAYFDMTLTRAMPMYSVPHISSYL